MASPKRSAIEITRILLATRTASVGKIESVSTNSLSFEEAIRETAPPDQRPHG